MGGKLLGWRTRCAIEIDPYCRRVLLARQRDGILEPFPIWDDVRTFDGKPWNESIDIVTGGFPCIDISAAGKGAGIDGEYSGLWRDMARIVGEVRPQHVFVENSPMLICRGLSTVVGDLAQLGFDDIRWGCLGANDLSGPHLRKRLWLVANAQRDQSAWPKPCRRKIGRMGRKFKPLAWDEHWKTALSRFRGMDDGMARAVDRTDAIRNGQIPAVVALAWNILK